MPKFNITVLTREQLQFHEFVESDALLSLSCTENDPVAFTTMPNRKCVLRLPAPLVKRNYDYIAKFFKRNVDSTNIVIHCDEELIHPETLVTAINTFFGLQPDPEFSGEFMTNVTELTNTSAVPKSYSIYNALYKQFK